MAYQSSIAEARLILDAGIAEQGSSGANITKGGSIFAYCSSHAAGDITGAGFFAGAGAQVHHSSGAVPYDAITRSTNNVGMRPGSILMNLESSGGATPGKVSWHAVTASTYGTVGFNCTVSAA